MKNDQPKIIDVHVFANSFKEIRLGVVRGWMENVQN